MPPVAAAPAVFISKASWPAASSLALLARWDGFWEPQSGESHGVLGLFAEEQGGEESEKRRRKRKGTKRRRDGRGPEGGAWACDLKLDAALDRTLEDGAKQHNLTAVNVRNILHVRARRPGRGGGTRGSRAPSVGPADFGRCPCPAPLTQQPRGRTWAGAPVRSSSTASPVWHA